VGGISATSTSPVASVTSIFRAPSPRPSMPRSAAAADEASTSRSAPAVEIRALQSHADYQACLDLQRETWGTTFSEVVPTAILKVSQRIGGVTAGAFDDSGRLLGFVFGMTGIERGRLVHWSDMLAVRPEAQNLGLGRRLKEYQRDSLLPLGVELIYWTFDPLVARNAHLNLNRLGVYVTEYVPDMYGPQTDSVLHRGLGTDRFVVAWPIGEQAIAEAPRRPVSALEEARVAPLLNPKAPVMARDFAPELFRAPFVRIEIPADIGRVQDESIERAAAWRADTRAAFLAALERGYRVAGFLRDETSGRCFYLLSSDTPSPDEPR
jgi:predicted GNAT superfamily acetyltransferase